MSTDFRNAILQALGHAPAAIEVGKLQRFPTSDRHGDAAGWCKLFDDGRAGVFGDWRTGRAEVWTAADARTMSRAERAALARQIEAATRERQAEQRRQWAENEQRIARLRAACVPLVPGDPVTLYLKHRGFAGVWPLPDCLRYAPRLVYWHDDGSTSIHPGMVAPLVAPDGRVVALHRTYLTRDGRKAAVPSVRKLTKTCGWPAQPSRCSNRSAALSVSPRASRPSCPRGWHLACRLWPPTARACWRPGSGRAACIAS
jgi:hypothetical protein